MVLLSIYKNRNLFLKCVFNLNKPTQTRGLRSSEHTTSYSGQPTKTQQNVTVGKQLRNSEHKTKFSHPFSMRSLLQALIISQLGYSSMFLPILLNTTLWDGQIVLLYTSCLGGIPVQYSIIFKFFLQTLFYHCASEKLKKLLSSQIHVVSRPSAPPSVSICHLSSYTTRILRTRDGLLHTNQSKALQKPRAPENREKHCRPQQSLAVVRAAAFVNETSLTAEGRKNPAGLSSHTCLLTSSLNKTVSAYCGGRHSKVHISVSHKAHLTLNHFCPSHWKNNKVKL